MKILHIAPHLGGGVGKTPDPAAALANSDIFFYPLKPDHYGMVENALIEAMSLSLAPAVLDNPAERTILRDGETGFIAHSIHECISLLQMLLLLPEVRDRISGNAARYIAEIHMPEQSVREFMILWLCLLAEPARHCDFRGAVGESPADWFLVTQCPPGAAWRAQGRPMPAIAANGTLSHFESTFPGDQSLARLRHKARAPLKYTAERQRLTRRRTWGPQRSRRPRFAQGGTARRQR